MRAQNSPFYFWDLSQVCLTTKAYSKQCRSHSSTCILTDKQRYQKLTKVPHNNTKAWKRSLWSPMHEQLPKSTAITSNPQLTWAGPKNRHNLWPTCHSDPALSRPEEKWPKYKKGSGVSFHGNTMQRVSAKEALHEERPLIKAVFHKHAVFSPNKQCVCFFNLFMSLALALEH